MLEKTYGAIGGRNVVCIRIYVLFYASVVIRTLRCFILFLYQLIFLPFNFSTS